MRIVVSPVNLMSHDYNELPVAVLNSQGVEVGRTAHLPPIRCVVSPPCGHCWYCAQYTAEHGITARIKHNGFFEGVK